MNMQTQTVQAEPLSVRASLRPESVNPETRTADLVFATGARVRRVSWIDGPFYEELSLDPKHVRLERINNGAPLLDAHNGYELSAVLGVVQSAGIESGKLTGTVRFARAEDDPKAEQAFRKVKDGILRNVSIGYRAHKMEKIEGGDEKIPVFRVVDWEPYEVSLVPMGADDGAKVRADTPTNECQVVISGREESAMAKEEDRAEAAAAQTPPAETNPEERTPAETRTGIELVETPVDPSAEQERADTILEICEVAELPVAFARALIKEKLSVVTAQRKVIDELMKRGQDGEGPRPGPSGVTETVTTPDAGSQLDALARKYAEEHRVTYGAALRAVQKDHPDVARKFVAPLLPEHLRTK